MKSMNLNNINRIKSTNLNNISIVKLMDLNHITRSGKELGTRRKGDWEKEAQKNREEGMQGDSEKDGKPNSEESLRRIWTKVWRGIRGKV
jgi:hypothetical protein